MPSPRQSLRTPPDFLHAVRERFGPIHFDAACTREDAVADSGYTWPEYDALERDWAEELAGATVWCNPPFKHSKYFSRKAAESQRKTCAEPPPRVLLLVPASVDSNWYWEHVAGKALVMPLSPRIQFVGEPTGIDCPLMLCAYGPWPADFRRWVWREKRTRAKKRVA